MKTEQVYEVKKDGGFVSKGGLILLVVASFLGMLVMLSPRTAHSQGGVQQYGGCLTPSSAGQICVGPRAGVMITRYDFSGVASGKFTGGFNPGVGYGIIFQSADPLQDWRKLELDLFFSTQVGGSSTTLPNNVAITGLLTFFDYISLGCGAQWIEQASGSAKAGIYGTAGLSINVGGATPAQVAARKAAIKKEIADEQEGK
ncbi:hypothetical protein UFOVP276_187 [uncultured Caudovirales phage]|uniref:Uncharacterized protein n=1 Tax=uncultured Caudovirales phage TaxID=2100421 RepID=A0A6J5LM06_9CAUD|nr:hypothetical protein UFOVP127_81 [uncultured Caudovirales phage]CAB4135231.1 hypothetical protein UFOVP276_187 [uncultured Caudovirales phage]